jgi:aerobic-type carbon monoxide dehydrogenase small subunit (CoxS/CutS family)
MFLSERHVNSCLFFAMMDPGECITTIEGLGKPAGFIPRKQPFMA